MPMFAAQYMVTLKVDLGHRTDLMHAEIAGEALVREGIIQGLIETESEPRITALDVTMTGLAETTNENFPKDRILLKQKVRKHEEALHSFVQAMGDVKDKTDDIPMALRSAYNRAVETLGLGEARRLPMSGTYATDGTIGPV